MSHREKNSAAKRTLYLIDGSGYIFRAYFAIRPLSTRDGTPTHAVLGFAKMLLKLLKQEKPEYVCITFDTGSKNFRHDMYPAYKANRDAPPEDLAPQIPLIHQLVEAMRLPPLLREGFEADDVIATLCSQAKAQGHRVVIVTGDKDLMQLVDEDVKLFDPLKDQYFDRQAVKARFGVEPEHVIDILALAGDTSDNIPGVRSVGPKSAAKLVETFGSLEQIIAGLESLDKRRAYEEKILTHRDDARLSRRLATLHHEVPCKLQIDELKYGEPDHDVLADFLLRIEAYGLIRDFGLEEKTEQLRRDKQHREPTEIKRSDASETTASTKSLPQSAFGLSVLEQGEDPLRPIDRAAFQAVLSLDALETFIAKVRQNKTLSVDLETTSLMATQADIVGIAMATHGHPAVYVPLSHHYLGVPKQLSAKQVFSLLTPILEDRQVAKVGQNLKYDALVFLRANIALCGITHDSMLAAYVLDTSRLSFGLNALSKDLLGHECITYDALTGTGKKRRPFSEVPIETASTYAAEDAEVALRLSQVMVPRLEGSALSSIYRDIEMPLLPVLTQMEHEGILVDLPALQRLGKEFSSRLVELENQAFAIVGEPINLGSPKQLAELFFEKLGYEPVKKTKTGYSTDQEVLETLAQKHDLPRIILQHRLLQKLKSTYVDALPKVINPYTGRVHTSFNQTGTATGRLSSSEPNLQNIPIRHENGRRIRSAFISKKGHQLISADYSQIELRIMAHLSEDEHFIAAFQRGEDIHRRTAQEILAQGQEPTPEMRRSAKAINFGILYGLSEFGLARNLDIPRAQARDYISAYFARYPKIRVFLDHTIEQGRELGYVSTLLGRRRPLPNLRSKNGALRQAAERVAMNTPIQGSAADLIKLAMIQVAQHLHQHQLKTKLLLQVHDELVLEAPDQEVEQVKAMLKQIMSSVWQLRVPLDVDVGHAQNWSDAH